MAKNPILDPLSGGHNAHSRRWARSLAAGRRASLHDCPTCPKCPHSAKREKPKGKLATALIGAAIGTIGFGMLTLGGRFSSRRR